MYAKAKRLVLQWEADATDGSRENEAAAWLVQASDALLLRTNSVDRRQREPIGSRIGLFLDGEWERVWDDFSREAEAMLVATRVDVPSTPTQHGAPPPPVHTSVVRNHGRALKLCQLERVGDAVKALMPHKRAPRNEETLSKVRGFFPTPKGDDLDSESLRSFLAGHDVEGAFSLDAFCRGHQGRD